MDRLILNSALIKYACFVVSPGEKSEHREEYLQIAQESSTFGLSYSQGPHRGITLPQKENSTRLTARAAVPAVAPAVVPAAVVVVPALPVVGEHSILLQRGAWLMKEIVPAPLLINPDMA